MKLNCPNKKCNHEWNYKGEQKFYCTCPRCLHKVPITKNNNRPIDTNIKIGNAPTKKEIKIAFNN